MTRMKLSVSAAAAAFFGGFTGCDGDVGHDNNTSDDDPIELVGTWATDFGEETISATRWDGFCLQKIERYDNEANVGVLETIGGDGCGLGFSRVIWNDIANNVFYYCTTAFGLPTAAEAAAAPEVNIDDGDMAKGCSTFPWSKLTRK